MGKRTMAQTAVGKRTMAVEIDRAMNGVHAIVDAFVRRTGGMGYEREDLVGIGMVGLAESLRRWDASRDVNLSTFTYNRVRGSILDTVRKEGRRGVYDVTAVDVEVGRGVCICMAMDLRMAIGELGETEAAIVRGSYVEDRSLRSIGKELGYTEGRVSQLRSVGLEHMREVLCEMGRREDDRNGSE